MSILSAQSNPVSALGRTAFQANILIHPSIHPSISQSIVAYYRDVDIQTASNQKTDRGIQIYSGVLLHLEFPLEPMAIKANGEMKKKHCAHGSQFTV